MPTDYPYPNPFEILRYLLCSLDLKQSNKRLDDLAGKRIYDPREVKPIIKECFLTAADRYIGRWTAEQISEIMIAFFNDYLHNTAGKIPADGVNRSFILELLTKTLITEYLVDFLERLYREFGGPHPSFWLSSEKNSIGILFSWLSEHEPNWGSYLANISKGRRDSILAWTKGNELPSAQSILLLSLSETQIETKHPPINWELVKPLIFIARSFEFAKREKLGTILFEEARLALWSINKKNDIGKKIGSAQNQLLKSIDPHMELIYRLQNDLMRRSKKSNPEKHRNTIFQIRKSIQESKNLKSTQYWIEWYDARWHVFTGKLKQANKLYKCAFENSLFVAGINQKYIIEEAIVVAACQPKPDKVFLKQLKWSLINFGYDIPSSTKVEPSQKTSDTIEDWEVEIWKSNFDQIFPKIGLFPGTDYNSIEKKTGPLVLCYPSKIKPDYRHPNRKIKIGDTWQRTMPQLIWFSLNEDVEICQKLIDRGASVNVQSETGDTPILLALEALNITSIDQRSLDDALFKLISKEHHTEKTINTRTQKRRLLPIISAIETGRPEIVKKVLKMAANPNSRGLTDQQTPLNICLKYTGMLKDPSRFWENQHTTPISLETLDSIRRQSFGFSGFMLNHQKEFFENLNKSPQFTKFFDIAQSLMGERILKETSIDSMRNIAKQLIEFGADVNAEHTNPIRGYTPLMLAAELDEATTFEIMLSHGGNIKKTYKDPRNGKNISIFDITEYFRSKDTLKILEDFHQYRPHV